ncbi:hypothetical protein V1280_002003 [Bradyrhizobium sp. AZCC 2230]
MLGIGAIPHPAVHLPLVNDAVFPETPDFS